MLLVLGEETVEEDIDLGVSQVSDVAVCTNDSLPFEMMYAVQNLGMHSEILDAVLLTLTFLEVVDNVKPMISTAEYAFISYNCRLSSFFLYKSVS
jgi:hypothetical protein